MQRRRAGPAYLRVDPARIQAGPAYLRADPAYSRVDPARIRAGPAYLRAGPAYLRADPAYLRAGPAYSRADPAYSRAAPAYSRADPAYSRTDPAYSRTGPGRVSDFRAGWASKQTFKTKTQANKQTNKGQAGDGFLVYSPKHTHPQRILALLLACQVTAVGMKGKKSAESERMACELKPVQARSADDRVARRAE